MRTKANTYLHLESYTYAPHRFDYTEKEKKKITALFPHINQTSAFKETLRNVTVLISCLRSENTPINLKKTALFKDVKDLSKVLCSLGDCLYQMPFSSQIKCRQAFLKFRGADLSFEEFTEDIDCLKLACEDILKKPGIQGGKDPHYIRAIQKLAEVWGGYAGKPTRRYDSVNSKTYGPFLEYLNWAIKSPIDRLRKEIKESNKHLKKGKAVSSKKFLKEIQPCPSLPNIAKAVIAFQKRMAKNPSK